jgi:hypothetical protein
MSSVAKWRIEMSLASKITSALTPTSADDKEVALRRVAILAITHFNKGGNAHHDYKITDSLAFVAVARVISFSVTEVDEDGAETGRVLLLPGKTNIGAKAASLAYKIVGATVHDAKVGDIPTSHIHWDGVVATTADDAFAEHSGKADKSEKAEDFLVLTLQDGPVLVPDIRRRAGSKHQWKTIERAKTKLKIISHREGFGPGSTVKWALPDPEPDAALSASSQVDQATSLGSPD